MVSYFVALASTSGVNGEKPGSSYLPPNSQSASSNYGGPGGGGGGGQPSYGGGTDDYYDYGEGDQLPSYSEEQVRYHDNFCEAAWPLTSNHFRLQPVYGQAADEGLSADEMNLKMLMNSVPGTPGEDYPIYAEVPETEFSCEGLVVGGYYADPNAECQVFHVCATDSANSGPNSKWSFLCPNGTIFNQNYFICDW